MNVKYISEFIGSFFLVSVVVGSGIMAENLSQGNLAVALLGNTIATGAILFVLINMFGSISGAHFNPAVSILMYLLNELDISTLIKFIFYQILGGMSAIIITHYIFEISIFQISTNHRGEFPLLVSEIIATCGLLLTILFVRKSNPNSVGTAVALFITAGYWFTSSTSFANPMVTLARIFTNTFTGIAPESIAYFISGQIIAIFISKYIYEKFAEKN